MTISAIAILVVAGYYFRSRQSAPVSQPDQSGSLPLSGSPAQTAAPQTSLPDQSQQTTQTNVQKLNLVSQSQAVDFFVDKGSNVFIVQTDGKIVRVSGGKAEVISSGPLANIINASFSFDGKRIMAMIGGDPAGNKLEIFNTEDKTWRVYPNIVQSAAWSPNSHKIAFLSPGDSGALYLLDTDTPNVKPVMVVKILQEDMDLNWISPTRIFLSDPPSAGWNSSLWSFDMSKKSLSPVILDRLGLETTWSSSTLGTGIAMFSNSNGQGGQLQLVDQNGKQIQDFTFLTLPSKCTFYDKPVQTSGPSMSPATTTQSKVPLAPKTSLTMVCGVPRDIQLLASSPLPDAYQKKALFTSDNFFEIDISAGSVKNIFNDNSKNVDSSAIKIFNQTLFFINRFDQKIYSLSLPK